MAFIIKDRVKESTTSTGTGAITLGGAAATFDTFQSYMTNGDTTYYAIVHTTSGTDEWEVGLGTWNTGNTLTRTTVLAGSNGTSAQTFSAGAKDVFMTYPAAHAALAEDDVTFDNITVTGTVDGRDVATDGTKLDTVEQNADATDAVNVAAAGALMRSGGTMTGALILNADPSAALGAATKEYVDTIASAGIHYHAPVRAEHPSNLNATYNNGSSGVGATLTNAGTNAALVLDSVSMVLNDRVLVANQTTQTQNGVYTVTTVGDGSTAWVLTRSTDTDTAAPSDPDAFGKGDAFFIKEGATNAGHLDVLSTAGTIVFGTTNIVFSEVAETTVYSGGTGITLTGTTFSIGQDVGTTSNVTFNQVTAAIIGNVTGNVTGDITGNAATATALATARTVQLSGDVTGSASFDGSANINITAAVQDDSHAHVISNVDGLQTALDARVPTSRTLTAGNGLTGGGDLTANRTFTVGGGTGITVNANDIAIDSSYTGFDSRYVNVTGDTMTDPLHVQTASAGTVTASTQADDLIVENSTEGGMTIITPDNQSARIRFTSPSTNNDVGGATIFYRQNINKMNIGTGVAGGKLSLQSGAANETMLLDGSGRVGIGTASPTDYDGEADNLVVASSGHTGITIASTGSNQRTNLYFSDGTVGSAAYVGGFSYDHSNDSLLVRTAATPRMTIDGSGVVEIPNSGAFRASSSNATKFVRMYAGGGTGKWDIYGNGANLRISDNMNAGVLAVDTGATFGGGVTIDSGNGDQLLLDNAGERFTQISFSNNGSQEAAIWYDATDNYLVAHANAGDGFKVQTGGSNDRLTIDASGNVTTNGTTFKSNSNVPRNFKLQPSASSTDVGLSHYAGNGSHGYQLYSDGTNYGFLDGNWGSWDLKKVKNGALYADEGSGQNRVFTDGYHPNADKWTIARTLTLSGDVTGSVSWDGSANASISASLSAPFGWIDTATGNYGTVKVDDDRNVTWAGYAIRDDWVLMSNGSAKCGLYDDNTSEWAVECFTNAQVNLYYNGVQALQTIGNGIRVGNTSSSDIYMVDTTETTRRIHCNSNRIGFLDSSNNWSLYSANNGAIHIAAPVDQTLVLSGSSSPYIRWQENSTNRFYIQWVASYNAPLFHNEETGLFIFRSNSATTSIKMKFEASDADLYGSIYATHSNEIGFLDDQDEWAYRFQRDSLHEWRINNSPKLTLTTSVLTLDAGTSSSLYVKCDDGGLALIRANGDNQGTGAVEVGQSDSTGGGMSYNGDGSPAFVSGETADHITFYRMSSNTRYEVFSYPYNDSTVTFNGNITTPNIYVAGSIIHSGDTDTNIWFGTNEMVLTTGNSAEVTINTTGVRLGDSGNGYFQPVSGNYGSIQIDGGAHGNWEGYSIGGRSVFMHDNNTATGIYNDVDNEWFFYGIRNGYTLMYYNGAAKLETSNTGVTVTGDLNSTSDIRYKKNIEAIDGALDKVKSLKGVTFEWDNDAFRADENTKKPNFTRRATGVIAQDVEKVLPEAVCENEDGMKNVAYGNMVGLLIEAIKEQQTQIDELKAQLNS
jgi:hypothetical protein